MSLAFWSVLLDYQSGWCKGCIIFLKLHFDEAISSILSKYHLGRVRDGLRLFHLRSLKPWFIHGPFHEPLLPSAFGLLLFLVGYVLMISLVCFSSRCRLMSVVFTVVEMKIWITSIQYFNNNILNVQIKK